MTYAKLLAAGRGMDAKEIHDSLRGLANDPRFGAVVALIEQIKEQTADVSCDPAYAGQHGSLEHAAGVRFGLRLLEGKLKNVTEARAKGQQRPESD